MSNLVTDWITQESLASVAIVVSCLCMVLTLIQISLLRRQLRLDSLIKIVDSNRAILSLGFDKPTLWESFDEDCGSVKDRRSQEERKRYFQLWLNHIHVMWKACDIGLYSKSEWHSSERDVRDMLQIEPFKRHWIDVEKYYPNNFRNYIRKLMPVGSTNHKT